MLRFIGLEIKCVSFTKLRKFSAAVSSDVFCSLLCLLLLGFTWMLDLVVLSHRFCSFFFCHFPFYSSDWIISSFKFTDSFLHYFHSAIEHLQGIWVLFCVLYFLVLKSCFVSHTHTIFLSLCWDSFIFFFQYSSWLLEAWIFWILWRF